MWESVKASAGRLFEIVDAEPVVSENRDLRLETGKNEPISSLQFSNLSFTYPNQNRPAIHDISFQLEPGKASPSSGRAARGRAQSSVLLLRFWDYSSGEIRLGGEPLHGLEQDEVRARCAVVSQSSYFFNASVRENLRLARPSASQEEIEAAAKQAQIHDFILMLPKGYETLIGEQGLRLSGGERQRLDIARALLKDAPILILDEPTANLDPLIEKQVLETLFEIMKGRTSLLITHRLVGLENVDQILVMEAGEIVERGTQAELLAQGGTFRRLWELQNRILASSP
jgi:ATP-binding cassette, subfamily C, bacterial CydC